MLEKPVVTVLMTVYNAEFYLARALESILNQTLREIELIVIDDGSTDASNEILKGFSSRDERLRVYHQENQGIYHSANRGFGLARGKYLARMDSDDIAFPDRLHIQVESLERDASLVLLGTAYELIQENGEAIRVDIMPRSDTNIRWHLLFHNAFAQSTVMFRMDILRKWGLQHNPDIKLAGDYHLWSKFVNYGKASNLVEPTIYRRYHERQVSETKPTVQQENATKISQENLKNLGISLSFSQVKKLRSWFKSFPAIIDHDEISLCTALVKILNKFSQLPDLDKKELRVIRGRWLLKILSMKTRLRTNWRWKCEVLNSLEKEDILTVSSYLRHRVMKNP